MLRPAILALLLSAAVSFTAPRRTRTTGASARTRTPRADTAIDACTRIIKTGKTRGSDLAIAYYNRAISFRQKNDNDSALADTTT